MKVITKNLISNYRKLKYLILSLSYLFIINYIFDVINNKRKIFFKHLNKTDINFYEFFQSPEIKSQIKEKNLTVIKTISCIKGNVGNALIMLNNLINICETIKCKNIFFILNLKINHLKIEFISLKKKF